ncbi:MAG TPA: hypothetical protein VGI03_03435 [Verrucomicrobiae bacterium]|jgi:hypothetical protein
MRIWPQHFNLYFALTLALALVCGCESPKKEKEKQVSAVRIHIEASADDPDTSQSISVFRADPLTLKIDKEPAFTEANLVTAKVIDTQDGFAIELNFDESSSMILEQDTTRNLGKHFAIFGQWGEKLVDGRWLAAPMITRRIYDGTMTFTPDMSRDEADEFILGLTNVVKKIQKGQLK